MDRSRNKKHRRILRRSLLASLCFHAAALFFLQRQSLWFSSSLPPAHSSSWIASMGRAERNQILKEAFEAPVISSAKAKTTDHPNLESLPPPSLKNPPLLLAAEPERFFSAFLPSAPFPAEELLVSNQNLSFSLPPQELLDSLFTHLPKDLIIPSPSKPLSRSLFPPPLPSTASLAVATAPPFSPTAPPSSLARAKESPSSLPSLPKDDRPAKAPPIAPLSHLPKLPSLAELDTVSYSRAFDAELVFSPLEEGYIFALTLIPRADLELPQIRQHYSFLIDRSNSIQRERLSATKSAIRRILEELDPDDTFNIIAFDSKIDKLSAYSLPAHNKSFAQAEDFLEKIELGNFFSPADLYKSLFLTLPGAVQSDELYTTILLTDGENLAKKGAQRALLSDWTYHNRGKTVLFVVAMEGDAHLGTLDAAAVFNKGKLIHSPTRRGIKRKLLKLMKDIHAPIAKNLACQVIPLSPQSAIELFPNNHKMPHLYLNAPYVILGKTDSLDDFILFVQGRLKGKWLNIKKPISFLNAKKGGASLQTGWALQKAYDLYEQYILDDNPAHLAEARALLEPHELQMAFE